MKSFLIHVKAPQVFINLTYGGFSYGNVLRKIKKQLLVSQIVGYTITPVKHSFIDQQIDIQYTLYDSVIKKLKTQKYHEIKIPYRFHNVLFSMFEKSLMKSNFKLIVDKNLCDHCNLCIKECPSGSITQSIKILDSCISCNHCVQVCPRHAITSKKSKFLTSYLKRKQKTSVVVR
jgi:NAD-dependent dihydropyrimidine dehydrogenase PreA subunit